MQPWDRQPNEPARWYARFQVFLNLGTHRTVEEAYRFTATVEGLKGKRPGGQWYEIAREWEWDTRAAAWDDLKREELRTQEADRAFDAREHRLQMIDGLLQAVFRVLMAMSMFQPDADTDADTANEWLPTLRVMFKDLITAQRNELTIPGQDAAIDMQPFSADEFAQAQQQLTQWRKPQRTEQHINRLVNILARIYPSQADASRVADQSGLATERIEFTGTAINTWKAVIREATYANRLDDLIAVIRTEYDDNPELQQTIQSL